MHDILLPVRSHASPSSYHTRPMVLPCPPGLWLPASPVSSPPRNPLPVTPSAPSPKLVPRYPPPVCPQPWAAPPAALYSLHPSCPPTLPPQPQQRHPPPVIRRLYTRHAVRPSPVGPLPQTAPSEAMCARRRPTLSRPRPSRPSPVRPQPQAARPHGGAQRLRAALAAAAQPLARGPPHAAHEPGADACREGRGGRGRGRGRRGILCERGAGVPLGGGGAAP